jgi:hypothetical protein
MVVDSLKALDPDRPIREADIMVVLTNVDATGAGLLTPKPQQECEQQDSGE